MGAAGIKDESNLESAEELLDLWYERNGLDEVRLSDCRVILRRVKAEPHRPLGHVASFDAEHPPVRPEEDDIKAHPDCGRGVYDLTVFGLRDNGSRGIITRRYVQISGSPHTTPPTSAPPPEQEHPTAQERSIRARSEATIQEKLLQHALGSGGGGKETIEAIKMTYGQQVRMAEDERDRARVQAQKAEEEQKSMASEHVSQIDSIVESFNRRLEEKDKLMAEKERDLRRHYDGLLSNQKTQVEGGMQGRIDALERDVDYWRRRAEDAERKEGEARKELTDRLREEAKAKDPAGAIKGQLGLLTQLEEARQALAGYAGHRDEAEEKRKNFLDTLDEGLSIARKHFGGRNEAQEEKPGSGSPPNEKQLGGANEGDDSRAAVQAAVTFLAGAVRDGTPVEQAVASALSVDAVKDMLGRLTRHPAGAVIKQIDAKGLVPPELKTPAAQQYIDKFWAEVRRRLAS